MIALYLTIFISFIIAVIFLILFLSSVKKGQYEDTYTPSIRMILEDEFEDKEQIEETTKNKN
jgi:cbb3-type cytochrome oxidase maturation protein